MSEERAAAIAAQLETMVHLLDEILACETKHDERGHAYLKIPARSLNDLGAAIAFYRKQSADLLSSLPPVRAEGETATTEKGSMPITELECPCCGDVAARADIEAFFHDGDRLLCGCYGWVTADGETLHISGTGDEPCPKCGPSAPVRAEEPTAPAKGSPFPLEHTRSCPWPMGDEECTCGLAWRVRLATEQQMHAAWRKRAEELERAALPPVRAHEQTDYEAGKAYLTRLFKSLAPQCEPLPGLLGLATQIDNYIAGLPPVYLAALPPVQEPPKRYPECQHHKGCQWLGPENAICTACGRPTAPPRESASSPSQGVRLDDLKALVAWWQSESKALTENPDMSYGLCLVGISLGVCADALSAALEGAATKGQP